MRIFKKILGYSTVFVALLVNILAIRHAYVFTFFDDQQTYQKVVLPTTWWQKVKFVVWGIPNGKSQCGNLPPHYQVVQLTNANGKLHCWQQNVPHAKGTVILFHGYRGSKRGLLDKANYFMELSYNVLLVDFYGAGQSSGHTTTVGFNEAIDVTTCVEFVRSTTATPVLLFGTSMGAVAVLRAVAINQLAVQSLMVECPFGSMQQTVAARFRNMNVPSFPMAYLLLFWGGVLHQFNPFLHNPTTYAEQVKLPTLLLYGKKDKTVSNQETKEIFDKLKGHKKLVVFEKAGHENFLNQYANEWKKEILLFTKQF